MIEIKHRDGDLLGAKFKRGHVWLSLGRGPGNTVIAVKNDLKEQARPYREICFMSLPKPHEIDPSTPVRAEELEERPY